MQKKKWVSMLITAMLSVLLVFGLAACGNNDGVNETVPGGNVDVVVPEDDTDVNVDTPDADTDVDVDMGDNSGTTNDSTTNDSMTTNE